MGGCVSIIMDSWNTKSMVKHSIIQTYRSYGIESEPNSELKTPGFSPIYRYVNTSDKEKERLLPSYYGDLNLVQSIQKRVDEIPLRIAFAYRVVERIEKRKEVVQGKERVFDYYYCGPRRTITYVEMWQHMLDFGRGLTTLGCMAHTPITIYEETRWEWLVSIYGIWTQGMVASTVYSNLGEDALVYALAQTASAAIICNGKAVGLLAKLLKQRDLNLIIIYLDDLPSAVDDGTFRMIAWKDLLQKGQAAQDISVHIPTNNDAEVLIMYTSGTTGDPKGVVHSHGSIAAGVRSLNHRIVDIYKSGDEKETYCAYLPLAHILEFGVVNIFLTRGAMVGFGSPRTLTDNYASPHGDLHEYRPLALIGVPRIFDTLKKAIEAKLPPPGSFKRKIFDHAYKSRLQALREGKETPYWNKKVFSQARAALGGRVQGMFSGGGPLGESTQEFVNVVFGGPLVLQGWGLTESVCCGATQRLGDLEPNCVGQLVGACECRLKDTEEYKHTDTPEPRGEICLRGPFLFKGYYKQPELTKEVLDEDGWFHTGDVGSFTATGKLRIIGRVKALAKNVLGEYIALEALEAMYSSHILVLNNCICVLVDPHKPYICALVRTDEEHVMKFAKAQGIRGSLDEVLRNPAFNQAAADSLVQLAKAARKKSFEYVRHVRVVCDEWTPENGLVTPTMKLRRTSIAQRYAKVIEELFSE